MVKKSQTKLQTLQKRHTAAIDEIEKYKLLVDSVQDYAIFLLDTDGCILTWNKGAEKTKGYSPSEIIGKHFSVFYTPKDVKANKPKKELEIALEFGRAEDEDWRLRKDGSKFWASVVITTLYDSDGNHVGFAKVTRDLTDRKMQEDDLRNANRALKSQRSELQQLNQAKDDFISLASHQLRTPATTTKQLLGLFTDGLLQGIDKQNLEVISKAYVSNDRLIEIVNSLLMVARIDSGKMILKRVDSDIEALIKTILDEFADTFKSRSQTVNFTNKSKIKKILIDPVHLRMAIENIISNASKYTHPHGTIDVELSSKKDHCIISITDNGVGIAGKDIAGLYEKFNRIPNDLSDEVGGTGLGLYWAKEVIKLHGGIIEVDSTLNEGTTFIINLPSGV